MTHYRAQPEDDPVLIVLCAVRDGQFGKSALNEVIDLWVAGQIGRTHEPPGAVEALVQARTVLEGIAPHDDKPSTQARVTEAMRLLTAAIGGQ